MLTNGLFIGAPINMNQAIEFGKYGINAVKIFWYIFRVVSRVKMPLIYYSNIRMDYDREKFWKNTVKKFSSITSDQKKFDKCLIHQVRNNNSSLINYETLGVKTKN